MEGAPAVAQRVRDLQGVLRILLHVIGLDARWSGSWAEPAQIGSHGPEPHLGHGGDLVVPLPAVARQAVQQDQQGAILRTVGQGLERHTARIDFELLQVAS
jgi:hypothetical protein